MVDYAEDLENCIRVLNAGGTIIYPTDTVWGVGCDATSASAIDNVFAVKQRPATKSMIVLVDSVEMLDTYVEDLTPVIKNAIKGFSKPTTVIYPRAKNLAENALAGDRSVGIRIVNTGFCGDLLRAYGKPIVSTSANISGHPTPSLFREIDMELLNGADYITWYDRDNETIHSPSQIVRFDQDGQMIILRA